MRLTLIFIRMFVYYQLLDLAGRAGYTNDPLLLGVDIILAYFVFMYWLPIFPPQNNHNNNTGG